MEDKFDIDESVKRYLLQNKYVRVAYLQEDGSYYGGYIYRDGTKNGLQKGDLVKVCTFIDPNAIAKVIQVNLTNEEILEAYSKLYPGDGFKTISRVWEKSNN